MRGRLHIENNDPHHRNDGERNNNNKNNNKNNSQLRLVNIVHQMLTDKLSDSEYALSVAVDKLLDRALSEISSDIIFNGDDRAEENNFYLPVAVLVNSASFRGKNQPVKYSALKLQG